MASMKIYLSVFILVFILMGCTQEASALEQSSESPAPIQAPPPPEPTSGIPQPVTQPLPKEPLPPVEQPKKFQSIEKTIDETGFGLQIPKGFKITTFTTSDLGALRFMAFSPDGILFVTMPTPKGLYVRGGGIDDGSVFALPDKDTDGKADEVKTIASGLRLPHGIAFYNNYLYVAEEHQVSRYPYLAGGNVGEKEVIISNLPTQGEDSHVSRTIGFDKEGNLYVSVGSSCNICEETEEARAAISRYAADGKGGSVFAKGLRNTVGFVFHPQTGELWATENGRDFLGDDVPPDEINILRQGKHYGWPYCYGNKVVDSLLYMSDESFCTNTEPSLYNIQAHSAPLGLRFIESKQFPEEWQGDLLVAYHGSWNRGEPTGDAVVRLTVEGNTITGEENFITGWLQNGQYVGRPVDLIFDSDGALYISDDKAHVIYKMTKLEGESSEKTTVSEEATLQLTSSAFNAGGVIPNTYSCQGSNVNPPLKISNAPSGTKSFVLVMDDPQPNAPDGAWVHWVVWNIAPTSLDIPENINTGLGMNGLHYDGSVGYVGPCPGKGNEHTYRFTVYALDTMLDLQEGSTKQQVESALEGHIVAEAELPARYKMD